MPTRLDTELSQYQHGRVPRDVRRAQIVSLAGELFAERGFQGTSMDELARRAGVTKPVVYEIFGSKDGLYRACVEQTAAGLAEGVAGAVAAAATPMEQLRAGATAFFRFAAEQQRALEVLLSGDSRFAGVIADMRRGQAELVTRLLTTGARDMGISVDERQAQGIAHAINGACEALATWARAHPDLSPEDLADWMVRIVGPGLLAMTTTQEHPAP